MSQQDTGLYKSFAWVLGALVFFTVFIMLMANIFSPKADRASDPLIVDAVQKQIEPVGQSKVSAAATEAPVSVQPLAAVDSGESAAEPVGDSVEGKVSDEQSATEPAELDEPIAIPLNVRAVVATNCAGCHENGVLGAQRNDDIDAWQALANKGVDALTASVVNGVGEMPARADTNLDDDELRLAVVHLLNLNTAVAEAGSEEPGTDSVEQTETEAVETTETAAETAEVASVAVAEPVQIPDHVKTAVDTVCAACHISGVGNAPKYGDKEDWDARMANGLDAITTSAIAGKGAMPPRGGTQLTDEEIRLAIQYMISK